MAAEETGAVARGVAWMLLARIGDRLIGILSIAVTARLLSPNDFGMFQMALSVMALVEVFAVFGFEWALIRHPAPEREHYDTAFTLQLLVASLACIVILVLADPFASFYRAPELSSAIMVMAFAPVISAINNFATVHFRRELRFEVDFWRTFVPRLISFLSCIALAVWLQSYWALVLSVVLGKSATSAMGFLLHPFRPRLSLARWRELLGFSVWLQISSVVEGLRFRIGDLVVGRMLGSHALAVYNMSNDLANMPQQEFIGALNTAVFSKYSRLQDNAAQFKSAYIDTLGLTFMVGLPAAVGLVLTAPAAVRVLLGPQWIEVAPMIQLVAAGAFANAVTANSSFVFMSTGRPSVSTALSALGLALLISLLLTLTYRYGLHGAAMGFTVAALLMVPAHVLVMRRIIGLKLRELWPRIWRTIMAAAVMAGALYLVLPTGQPETLPAAALTLALAGVVGGAIYAAVVGLLWSASGRPASLESMLLVVVRDILGRVRERLGLGRGAPK